MKRITLLISLVLALVVFSSATALTDTFYISPTGNDANSGRSPDSPWATFNRAWQDLYPGDTLILLDGVYYQTLHPNKRNGGPGKPITIRAQNVGKAIVDGQHQRITVKLGDAWPGPIGDYFVIEGIVARNSSEHVYRIIGHNNTLRRVSGYNANTDENVHVFGIAGDNNLIEDCVASGTGRKMILIFQGEHNTIRRCFANWQEWDGRNRCSNDWPWGDNIEIYNASHNTIENSIAYGGVPTWSISVQANSGSAISNNNQVLGSMAINAGMDESGNVRQWPDVRPGNCTKMRDFSWSGQRAGFMNFGQGTLRDNLFQDIFAWGNAGLGFTSNRPHGPGPQNSIINHATIINNGLDAPSSDGGIGTNMRQEHIDLYTVTNSRIEGTNHNGAGARLTHRYIGGQLTDEPLWPWPMEDRIQAELGFSVTDRMLAILPDNTKFRFTTDVNSIKLQSDASATLHIHIEYGEGFDSEVRLDVETNSPDLVVTPSSLIVTTSTQATFELRSASGEPIPSDTTYLLRITAAEIADTGEVMTPLQTVDLLVGTQDEQANSTVNFLPSISR